MSCRIVACFIFSSFVCFAQIPVAPSHRDPASVSSIPSITRSHPSDARISVVRLRVPAKARGLYNNAFTAFVKQKFAEAVRKVDAALKLCPAYPDALTLRGGIYINQRRWATAEEDFLAAIGLDPTYLPAYVGLADVYNSESRFDDALAVAQRADAVTSGVWNMQYESARAFIGKRQYQHALAIIDEAIRRKPDDHHLLRLARAHALVGLKHYFQAETDLRDYLTDDHSADDQPARDLLAQIETAVGQ